jgi:acetate kinase
MSPADTAPRTVLCLNTGSSSLKFALYRVGEREARLADGAVERVGLPQGRLWIRKGGGARTDEEGDFAQHEGAVRAMFSALERLHLPRPAAVGHRLVHGGADHAAPERVDAPLLAALRELIPFAPLHLPSAIQAIEAVAGRLPDLPQVACFDTAFHRNMPEVARRLPLKREFWDEGLRRYGFHGLSYEFIVGALGPAAQGRVVIAHLGNGASLAAVREGKGIDTTMGFTPTGGFMMGTRSGDLDPGVLLYLMNEKGYDAERLERLVDHESGLLGVSGHSPDMKTLRERRAKDPHAAQAVEMFCYQLAKHIAAMTAALGGLDTLVFTGGIGEHAASVRWEVCLRLAHLGIRLDPARNEAGDDPLSTSDSPCTVRVIPTEEDLMIARHTQALIFPAG